MGETRNTVVDFCLWYSDRSSSNKKTKKLICTLRPLSRSTPVTSDVPVKEPVRPNPPVSQGRGSWDWPQEKDSVAGRSRGSGSTTRQATDDRVPVWFWSLRPRPVVVGEGRRRKRKGCGGGRGSEMRKERKKSPKRRRETQGRSLARSDDLFLFCL